MNYQIKIQVATLPNVHREQHNAVRHFDLDSADPKAVEHQLNMLHAENLRLQRLVTELLIKNQQLRAADPPLFMKEAQTDPSSPSRNESAN